MQKLEQFLGHIFIFIREHDALTEDRLSRALCAFVVESGFGYTVWTTHRLIVDP